MGSELYGVWITECNLHIYGSCAAVAVSICRRTLAPAAAVPPEKKEQLFPKGGKAMIGGRSFTSK